MRVAATRLCHSEDHTATGRLLCRRGAVRPGAAALSGAHPGCDLRHGQTDQRHPRELDHHRQGTLKLDELINPRYSLDEVAQGYVDMHVGINICGVVTL